MQNFDLANLRTLALFQELGGVEQVAQRIGRTQAAVSLQLKRLEAQAGATIFEKSGRRLHLTDAGLRLLEYAREMLRLNDEALGNLQKQLAGEITLGIVQDLADRWLLPTLNNFRLMNPGVQIKVRVDRNYLLQEAVKKGELDFAILAKAGAGPKSAPTISSQMVWVSREKLKINNREPVRLALFEDPCFFRSVAIDYCKKHRIPFEVTFTSSSLAAVWSAVRAGFGVTVRSALSYPDDLEAFDRLSPQSARLGSLRFYLVKGNDRKDLAYTSLFNDLSSALLRAEKPKR